ncbi:MAG: amidohydrolase family protein [Gemmatimonadales bacterium]
MKRMLLAVLFCLIPTSGLTAQDFDILIRGGQVMDGTGNPWFRADVGIRDGRIAAVGRLDGASASRTINATGKVVSPGFIDLHSHADDPNFGPRGLRSDDPRRRAAPNLVMQGITTVVVNADGRSPWPIADQRAELEAKGFGPNAILMVGHGTVRGQVMGGDFRRPATADEVRQMRALVRQGMEEGAHGLSAGLEYTPGRWSETDEVVALVEEIVPYGGVYIAHQRSEGADPMWYWPSHDEPGPPTLLDAVMETIEIGERTGATVVASHIKAKGAHYWGSSSVVIRMINEARARGVSVYADQYPYNTTGSDGNTVLIPRWVFERGRRGLQQQGRQVGQGGQAGQRQQPSRDLAAALRSALEIDSIAALVKKDIAHEIRRRGGAENIVVLEYPDEAVVGKSLAELSALRGASPVEMAIALQLEGSSDRPGGGTMRGFSLSDYDIEPYAAEEWTATATDGWIVLPEDGFTHTRVYGTFPRKIAYYARDEHVLSVEDAVRTSTSLPAQVLGLEDRGRIDEGYVADLVVFDLMALEDRATFFEPHQYPAGIEYVLIAAEFVVDGGEPTWALPGKVITP